jgi:hypothetical protein
MARRRPKAAFVFRKRRCLWNEQTAQPRLVQER